MSERVLRKEIMQFVALNLEEGYSHAAIADKMDRNRATVTRHIDGYLEHGEDWIKIMNKRANKR